ncbi:MAG TPA: DEAD/DEAH box helicase [Polyangiaceae bacterium]|nr:DEAD/DEAH box helicase [Polyangiaceae bacterium]
MATDPLSELSLPARAWFQATLGAPTPAQALGLPSIIAGNSTLLLSPTGSGKTLAAFLFAVDKIMHSPEPPKESRCRVLYVSPLKALAVDIERNLRTPIAGISEAARKLGVSVHVPTLAVRTGDTPAALRARMQRMPPDILITTPESLFLLLTSAARKILHSVETLIVDEIHSLVQSKRGAHLFLSLERVQALRADKPLQRIGLSATQRPLDEIARLLVGFDAEQRQRPVTIIDAAQRKTLRLSVELPEPAVAVEGNPAQRAPGEVDGAAARATNARSVWPAVHERLVTLIREHRTTMIFVNSRRLAERLAAALNEVAGSEVALAHHGSVAREKRQLIEERLKSGSLPALVATSSLELGLDIGAVDLVVQIEAPPSIASGLQRVGRAQHHVGGIPEGVLMPKHKADLLATAAAALRMREGSVEATFYPRNPLDVLAQQLVAMCAVEPHESHAVDTLYRTVRGAAPFSELPRAAFEGVLDMLSGRYPSDEFPDLRPRLVWDRQNGSVRARSFALRLAVTNAGTIPDRGLYGVFLMADDAPKGGRRVGELDEEMVFELREGEVFLLGASSWRAEQITHDRVLVSPAAGEPGKMPFWHGDRPGRPLEFGKAVGALTRTLSQATPSEAEALLVEQYFLDAPAARALTHYVHEQTSAVGEVPSDRAIVIERFLDEVGDHRVCVLTPFGSRVHAPWATAVTQMLRARRLGEVESVWSDDGMVFRIPASDTPPPADWFLPSSSDVEARVSRALDGTSLFAARFREAAGRALLLPRRHPTRRQPLWALRKRAADLLAVAAQHPSFPIVLETYRECLRDVFDLPGLVSILADIEQRRVRVRTVDTLAPSPFSASLLFSFVANFVYEGDAPLAERRAQALTIDHEQLRELLGESELRSLLDPQLIAEHERFLQRLTYPAKDADSLCDVLRALGDLTPNELCERSVTVSAGLQFIAQLEREQRVFQVKIRGETRYLAIEDAGRYRDALGVEPLATVPSAFLEPVPDALTQIISRYARNHGPFPESALSARYGLPGPQLAEVVRRLHQSGRLVRGAFLAGGTSEELCDAEVLRSLRQRSLAQLRREVEPVEPVVLCRFLLDYQGTTHPRRGDAALLDAIAQLEGCPLPASALLRDILPARVRGMSARDLDALLGSGEVVWAGVEAIGSNDGRIALYLAEHEALLARTPSAIESDRATAIRAVLARRGALFFAELLRETGGFPNDVLSTLWDMVWAGEVTNDSLEALRSWLRPASSQRETRSVRLHASRRRTSNRLPGSEGRWSLRSARWGTPPSDTERRTALARALLDRYGVVTREVAQAEALEGGFSSVYEILKVMESAGRVRRGYFVAGHGGVQFAQPGADDELRAQRTATDDAARAQVLSAVDPANPYGALLPWPEREGSSAPSRLARSAGAFVVLHQGALVGYLQNAGALTTFGSERSAERERALASALAAWARAQPLRRALQIASIDGNAAAEHEFAEAFREAGFVRAGAGLLLSLRELRENGDPERDPPIDSELDEAEAGG